MISESRPATGYMPCPGIERDNTPSRSTINGEYAFASLMAVPTTWSSVIIIETRFDMSIPNTTEMKRRPTHPGEMLREDFLPDYGLTVSGLADAIGMSRQSINELLRERRAVSPEMALRLARLFGNSPEFWLNAQRAVDLWEAARTLKKDVAQIKPLDAA